MKVGYRGDKNNWRDGYKNHSTGNYAVEIVKLAVRKDPDWKELLRDGGKVDSFAHYHLGGLKPTQLRKFFDQVRQLKDKARNKNVDWRDIEADLWMIVPTLKYAKGRKSVPDDFLHFVTKGVEAVSNGNSEEEKRELLLNFIKVFEAVVAYHKFYHPKD